MRKTLGIFFTCALFAGSFVPGSVGAFVTRDDNSAETFDVRAHASVIGPTHAQGEAIMALAREMPSVKVEWNPRFGTPRTILRYDGDLAGARAGTADDAARAWLRHHAALFGWSAADVAALRTAKTLPQPNGGPVAVLLHQRFGQLEGSSLGGSIVVALATDNRVLSVRANVVRTPSIAGGSRLGARDALAVASGSKPLRVTRHKDEWTILERGPFVGEHWARRVAFPVGGAAARPAWEILFIKNLEEAYRTVVDAQTGAVLYREQIMRFEAPEGRIFRNYPFAPRGGTQEMASFAGDPDASPAGWLSPVSKEASGVTTIGNNATTATNWIGFVTPDGPGQLRPVAPDRVFDYEFTDAWHTSNCGSNPVSDQTRTADTPTYALDALPAVVNLFYHHNVMHDFFHGLGFNEAAGSLQANNFGKGGMQEDPIIGLVQAGAVVGDIDNPVLGKTGRDNASMLTLPDGVPSWSQMYVFEPIPGVFNAPCVDGDFDAQVIYHEYTHAVSTRWVGGEWGNLGGLQGGSMGEAWSDFYALHFLHEAGVEKTTAMGPYVTADSVRGIRNWPLESVEATYGDIGYDLGGPEVHSDGEIWAGTLWDIRSTLKKARPGGAALAAQLIADAMPISGSSPTMLNMRDMILKADAARTKGANQQLLWSAFTRRGMGVSAKTLNAADADPIPGFDSAVASQNGTLTGRVVDAATGAPIAGAKIIVGKFEVGVTPIGRTATDGTFTLKMAENRYPIKIVARGYGSHSFPISIVAGQTTNQTFSAELNYASRTAGAKALSATNSSTLGLPELALDDNEASTWRTTPDGDAANESFVIDLAGDTPVTITSLTVSARPLRGSGRWATVRDFSIEKSMDGQHFTPLTKGGFKEHKLRPLASTVGYRTWRLPRPVAAKYLKITALGPQYGQATSVQVAEVAVHGSGAPITVPPPTAVGTPIHAEGQVVVPTQNGEGLLTARLMEEAVCTFPPATQGVDAFAVELPDDFGDGTHTFDVRPVPPLETPEDVRNEVGDLLHDIDVYFMTSDCVRTGQTTSANGRETGIIPQASKYLVAELASGPPLRVIVDAAPERIVIPKAKTASKPKPAVRGVRTQLPATGVGSGIAGGLAALSAAAGVTAWLRPRRRRA